MGMQSQHMGHLRSKFVFFRLQQAIKKDAGKNIYISTNSICCVDAGARYKSIPHTRQRVKGGI